MINHSREKMLKSIRIGLGRGELSQDAEKTIQQRLADHPTGIIPKRSKLDSSKLIELFIRQAENADAIVKPINALSEVPIIISETLNQQNLSNELFISKTKHIKSIPWETESNLTIHFSPNECNEKASLTEAECGVAETGTVILKSSDSQASQLNFLAKIHFVLLSNQKIVGSYEDSWSLLRQSSLPRTINYITGPSRTGDIEQKILLGAHGPKVLVILIY